jgi:hypothetical protein
VAAWYWDQDIHDWYGQHLYRLQPLDTRWYVIADRDKRSGRNWQQIILRAHARNSPYCVVQDLEHAPAYPTRKDKARCFVELMGKAKGASRASYYRLLARLEQQDVLVPRTVPSIRLSQTRPPGTSSSVELEAMEAPSPDAPEEEPQNIDVPVREQFTQPIRGQGTPQTSSSRAALDDSVAWEVCPRNEEDDEE